MSKKSGRLKQGIPKEGKRGVVMKKMVSVQRKKHLCQGMVFELENNNIIKFIDMIE